MKKLKILLIFSLLLIFATTSSAITLSGWTGEGSYGTLGADGVVTLSPYGDPQYGWVSTNGGITGVALPGIGGTGSATNGSRITSPLFSANSGDELNFFFNYVTSDGAGYADYAWARLLDSSSNQVSLLFTARTTPGGDTVPGFAMPTPDATLTPPSTPIIPGGPEWSPLGGYSGSCWSTGCGYTGWIEAAYTIDTTGDYFLEFGVTNWNDTIYDSGMAFDGTTIAGTPINGDGEIPPIPEPTTFILLGSGLAGLALFRRAKKN